LFILLGKQKQELFGTNPQTPSTTRSIHKLQNGIDSNETETETVNHKTSFHP